MKKKPIETALAPLNAPETGSARAASVPHCVPAFPAGREGRDMLIAVPVLLMVPVGKAVGVAETIADAVSIVRTSQISVESIPVKAVMLADSDECESPPKPTVRSNFLGRALEALSWVGEAMVKAGGHNPEEVKQVEREACEVLYLLNASDPSKVSG